MTIKNKHIAFYLLLVLSIAPFSCRKSNFIIESNDVVINDNGGGTGTTIWEKGKEYLLEGRVFVNDGQVLTIEAGAVIRFKTGDGAAASALIVARGGKIIAEGTASDPIVFTSENDDLEGSVDLEEAGLWGGLIILGSASINTPTGEAFIEGIPLSEPRGIFGGNNDNDNSGVLKYVSIRHSGTELGNNNEINGLTLGGVGNATTIENIEVVGNADDGIEIFGGNVNLKRIAVAFSDDDAIDIDLGYQGSIQFVCLIQHELYGDKMLEIDGGEEIKTSHPYSLPQIYNITAVGRGENVLNSCISFWDNAGGTIANSIFVNQTKGIDMEYSASRHSSFNQWEIGNLKFENNLLFNVNENNQQGFFHLIALNDETIENQTELLDGYFKTTNNQFIDPGFVINEDNYSLITDSTSIFQNLAPLPQNNNFLEEVNYKGAFGTYNWLGDWSLLNQQGIVW